MTSKCNIDFKAFSGACKSVLAQLAQEELLRVNGNTVKYLFNVPSISYSILIILRLLKSFSKLHLSLICVVIKCHFFQ